MTELARYDSMCRAIAECHSVDEVKDLHDKARALEIYAKQAMNVEAERKATEIRLRAERRAGELMAALRRIPPQKANPNGRSGNESPATTAGDSPDKSEYREAIETAGITERTAQRWQGLAAVPEPVFEQHLADPIVRPTTNGILKAANGAPRMDDASLWLWGRLRDFERDGHLQRDVGAVFGGMTDTMQADVRRILPSLLDWLSELLEVSR